MGKRQLCLLPALLLFVACDPAQEQDSGKSSGDAASSADASSPDGASPDSASPDSSSPDSTGPDSSGPDGFVVVDGALPDSHFFDVLTADDATGPVDANAPDTTDAMSCPQPTPCSGGETDCSSDGTQALLCGSDNNGCAAWEVHQSCTANQVCIAGGCQNGSYQIVPIGTDILVVAQEIPLAVHFVADSGATAPVEPSRVTWQQSTAANGLLEFATAEGQDLMRGLDYGGGDKHSTDGSVWIQATVDASVQTQQLSLQVILLGEGTGLYPQGPKPGAENFPEEGEDPKQAPTPGPARYDGMYLLDDLAHKWYCNETTTCPEGGTCNLTKHACVGSNNANIGVTSHCDWNTDPCAPHRADIRLHRGESISLGMVAFGTYAQFSLGQLVYAEPDNWPGPFAAPSVARPLYIDWSIFPGERDDVVEIDAQTGQITALATGRTAVTGWIGIQGITFEVVVYDQYGYIPSQDYAVGMQGEAGHLLLFSSSNGPASAGTHDTIRVLDLEQLSEQDRRPSKYGPQGLRLIENGDELFGGGGCGLVQGQGGQVFLLGGSRAISVDSSTMQQGHNRHQVNFPDGVWVCQGAFWEDSVSGQSFLFGSEMAPVSSAQTRLWIANVTDLASADVTAVPYESAPFDGPSLDQHSRFDQPAIWTDATGGSWLLGVSRGTDGLGLESLRHYLHAISLGVTGTTLDTGFAVGNSVACGLPQTAYTGWHGHAGLQVATFKDGRELAFVGNEQSITVVDLEAGAVVSYSDQNPHGGDGMESRWYGYTVKDFALSPDASKLYALAWDTRPQNTLYCDDAADCAYVDGQSWTCDASHRCVDHHGDIVYPNKEMVDFISWQGHIRSTGMTGQRVAIIDLAPADPENRPVFDQSIWDCFREDTLEGTTYCQALPHRRLGIDLRHLAFKKHFIDQYHTGSEGAVPAILALNIRQIAVSENSLFAIGADNNDGQGSALANLTDLAVFNLNPAADGHTAVAPVFRGYRGDGFALQGLSDALGIRLGERDGVLGHYRVKNAGVMYLPGAPPADNPGNGAQRQLDDPLPSSANYGNAPDLPSDDTGRLVVVGSAPGNTMGTVREIHLDSHMETDNDGASAGAQGVQLMEQSGELGATCGVVRGAGDEVWFFTGTTAVAFDSNTMSQLYGNNYISWPGSSGIRFCHGAYWQSADGSIKLLFGIDLDDRPGAPLAVADLSGLGSGNVSATAVEDQALDPYGEFQPRFIQALTVGDDLFLLEKNEPRNAFRNVVHRVAIGAAGGLTFDDQRDLLAEYTSEPTYMWGDPGMALATFDGADHLFIGNQNSITVYNLANPSAPVRLNYNSDGDSVHDDLDSSWYGRSICAFATNPAGDKLYALPYSKSGLLPLDTVQVPLLSGATRTQVVDRFRVAVLDLATTVSGRPEYDASVNSGNGIDLVYTYLKQAIVDEGISSGMMPPLFYTLRRSLAVSNRSLFIIGYDAYDGAGSALAYVNDVGMFDLSTGRGYLQSDVAQLGYPASTNAWGYQLGVDDQGNKASDMPRGRVGAMLYLP